MYLLAKRISSPWLIQPKWIIFRRVWPITEIPKLNISFKIILIKRITLKYLLADILSIVVNLVRKNYRKFFREKTLRNFLEENFVVFLRKIFSEKVFVLVHENLDGAGIFHSRIIKIKINFKIFFTIFVCFDFAQNYSRKNFF